MKNDIFLRAALTLNGLFSFSTGAVMAGYHSMVSRWITFDFPFILQLTGIGLILFAACLLALATIAKRPQFFSLIASFGDFLWVIATVVLGIVTPAIFSVTGWLIVITVAIVVLACGILQAVGIDRSFRHPDKTKKNWRHCWLDIDTSAEINSVWNVVSDLGSIARYSAFLSKSEIIGSNTGGRYVYRECQGQGQKRWRERISLDDTTKRLDILFLSDRPDFPFPFRMMEGAWLLIPQANGTRIQVWWDVVPRVPAVGFLILPVFLIGLQNTFPKIIKAMEADIGFQENCSEPPVEND